MATSSRENVQRLLSKYTFQTENEFLIVDLTCIICKKILNNAYQSYCSCNYCYQCIVDYLYEGEKFCIGGNEECKEEPLQLEKNVTGNVALNRKILKVKVNCPNDFCSSIVELIKMEEHLRLCCSLTVECPYGNIGCNHIKNSQEKIEEHLRGDIFEHAKLLIDVVESIKNENSGFRESIDLNKTEIMGLKEQLRLKEIEGEDKDREFEDMKKKLKNYEIQREAQNKEIKDMKTELRNKESYNKMHDSMDFPNVFSLQSARGSSFFTTDEPIYIYETANPFSVGTPVDEMTLSTSMYISPKQLWFSSAKGKSLEIQGTFYRHSNSDLFMDLTLSSHFLQPITDLAIQFNKNSFGLSPSQPPAFPASPLLPYQTVACSLQLNLSGPVFKMKPLTIIQVALRTNIDVLYFQCEAPLNIYLVAEGEMEKRVFLSTWKDIPGDNETQYRLSNMTLSAEQCSERLRRNNIFTIAKRNVDCQDMLYQSMKLTNGIWILAELKIKPGDSDYTLSLKSKVLEVYPSLEKFYNECLR